MCIEEERSTCDQHSYTQRHSHSSSDTLEAESRCEDSDRNILPVRTHITKERAPAIYTGGTSVTINAMIIYAYIDLEEHPARARALT